MVPAAVGPRYAAERVALGERSQALVSSVRGVDTMHAYADEARHRAVVDDRSARSLSISLDVFGLFTDFGWRANRAEYVGLAVVLGVGFVLVRSGDVTVGAVTTTALLFHRLFGLLGLLLFTFDDVQSAGASLVHMVAIRGRTTLVVTHRLTQAARADRVVVLAAGRVVEQGTHAELVGAGGGCARLWVAWSARG